MTSTMVRRGHDGSIHAFDLAIRSLFLPFRHGRDLRESGVLGYERSAGSVMNGWWDGELSSLGRVVSGDSVLVEDARRSARRPA